MKRMGVCEPLCFCICRHDRFRVVAAAVGDGPSAPGHEAPVDSTLGTRARSQPTKGSRKMMARQSLQGSAAIVARPPAGAGTEVVPVASPSSSSSTRAAFAFPVPSLPKLLKMPETQFQALVMDLALSPISRI